MGMENVSHQDSAVMMSKSDIAKLMRVFSHDLRNPLINMRALAGDIQTVLEDADGDEAICTAVREDLPENLDMMQDVISRMDMLISGANEIYHSMFDDLEYDVVDLGEWVKREVARKKDIVDAKKIDLTLGKIPPVWADALAVQRIVAELLDNALYFTEQGGHISLYSEEQADADVLVVKDNGLGINESDMKRIFQPFFSTNREHSGIGLALVKALVQAHGGRIWCESSVGMGSVFHVSLPRQRKHS